MFPLVRTVGVVVPLSTVVHMDCTRRARALRSYAQFGGDFVVPSTALSTAPQADPRHELVDLVEDHVTLGHLLLDLVDGVHDRGVVTASEDLGDTRVAVVGELRNTYIPIWRAVTNGSTLLLPHRSSIVHPNILAVSSRMRSGVITTRRRRRQEVGETSLGYLAR